jgi:hypothetical protein
VKVNPDKRLIQFGMCLKEHPIAETERLQDQLQLAAKDGITPASGPEYHPATHVAVDMKARTLLILLPLGQHLIPHQPCVPSGDSGTVVLGADGKVQIARPIRMRQGIAPRRDRSSRIDTGCQSSVKFLGSKAIHQTSCLCSLPTLPDFALLYLDWEHGQRLFAEKGAQHALDSRRPETPVS